jgi:photosystem II stability/assembly factor-like uncharacterized protein
VRSSVLLLALGLSAGVAAPASAQWIRVGALPASDVFSVRTQADTIVAGTDTSVFVSTNAGATWRRSSKPAPGVILIGAVLMLDRRLYAGTFGQGVLVSDDLGTTWQPFNQGLVGGLFDSQLDISDFEVRGDSLLVSTFGDGVFVRQLSVTDTWHPFGGAFELNQAANVIDLAVGNARLFACAGDNGMAFDRDPGTRDWTVSTFANGPLVPGLEAQSAIFTGTRWVVGTNAGVFLSPSGQDAWTPSNTRFSMKSSTLVSSGQRLFIGFDLNTDFSLSQSQDNGTTWSPVETVPNTFGYQLAVQGDLLYAGRSDGLWFRSTGTVSVGGGGEPGRLRFALAGRQPVRDAARFHFDLPRAGDVAIDVFDLAGRRAAGRIEGFRSAGSHEVTLDTSALAPGVYLARVTADGASESARMVCVH